MVKVIVADRKIDCEHLLGQFVDETHYDILVEEDTDCYMPAICDLSTQATCEYNRDCSSCDKGKDERRIAFKFRKNFFSKEEQQQAYIGLRDAATLTQNRGLAAGPRGEKQGHRDWVTDYQLEILEHFMKPVESLFGGDPVEEIKSKHVNASGTPSRGMVWLANKIKEENFNFDSWVEKARNLPKEDAAKQATHIANTMISQTTYANAVHSGIAGWYDRYPRIPYGRATAYTAAHPEKFKMAYPFLQTLSRGFKELLPWRFGNQMREASKIDPAFVVPETPFTTITVNKSFRTAAHFDAGDYADGLSNLLVLSNNGNYKGGYLVFPEYRVAVNVRPGDLLLVNNHEVLHGNTPIELMDEEAERISLVCYLREGMLQLGSKDYEDARYDFVESRRLNKEHPEWRPLWNGVSAGMWESDEWYTYLETKLGTDVLIKYHPESQKSSLETFF